MRQLPKVFSFHVGVFLIALIIYSITAFNSHGYYHPDEHYQIIEFAGFKSGTHNPDQLAWEFKERIRSAIQPAICFFIFKVFNFFNANDPYTLVFLLRLLTAILTLAVISTFVRRTVHVFSESITKKAFIITSYLLWFLPFLSVRFSSETWSGILFLYGIAIYTNKNRGNKITFFVGLIVGISFLFRFQAAFMILGFLLWLILIRKIKASEFLELSCGLITAFVCGVLIDWWFYEELVFSAWNYFYVNIIQSKASVFGVSPWYFYLEKTNLGPGAGRRNSNLYFSFFARFERS